MGFFNGLEPISQVPKTSSFLKDYHSYTEELTLYKGSRDIPIPNPVLTQDQVPGQHGCAKLLCNLHLQLSPGYAKCQIQCHANVAHDVRPKLPVADIPLGDIVCLSPGKVGYFSVRNVSFEVAQG